MNRNILLTLFVLLSFTSHLPTAWCKPYLFRVGIYAWLALQGYLFGQAMSLLRSCRLASSWYALYPNLSFLWYYSQKLKKKLSNHIIEST